MRIKDFQKEMKKKDIGLSVFFNLETGCPDPNITYFSQYTGLGILAITSKKALLIVPKMEFVKARRTSRVRAIVAEGKLTDKLKKTIKNKPRKVGIDKNRLTLNLYKSVKKAINAKYVDISQDCLMLRARKTKEEIKIIRKACKITDEIMHTTFWNFKSFKTEADVYSFMIDQANKRGLETSFKPIIASGANASSPHHEPQGKKLKKGFCIIDFGIRYKGYCSDITRTIYLGRPSEKEISLYYEVLQVQKQLIESVYAGQRFTKINEKAQKLFGKDSKYFIHSIGHGIGTDIHENPTPKKAKNKKATELLENSIITIEPGIYYPNRLGIRIEDDVLVTKKGADVLTKTGKNLLIIRPDSKHNV